MGLYKTKICRTWENEGFCNYSGCKFAHGKKELCFPKDSNGYMKRRAHSNNVPKSNYRIPSSHPYYRKTPSLDNYNYNKRKYDNYGHYDNNGEGGLKHEDEDFNDEKDLKHEVEDLKGEEDIKFKHKDGELEDEEGELKDDKKDLNIEEANEYLDADPSLKGCVIITVQPLVGKESFSSKILWRNW
ncbi:hypothetical protein M758_4G198100 [Ceratodon purpureus]|nr:hypothetical protein M758_4G198100 [Ceratodon purpureus]